ncbi:MAG: lytic transglycosylase domain-containing protein [Duodenibacillus sp.]|nr:lytic transglycosylase domain-containing protein [Duodenibacillus sp.]
MIKFNQHEIIAALARRVPDSGRFVLVGLAAFFALIAACLILAWSLGSLPAYLEYQPISKPIPVGLLSGSVGDMTEPVRTRRQAGPRPLNEQYVAWYVARGYRIDRQFARKVVANAVRVGRELDVDPLLILSVIAVESSFNPKAQSSVGAQGLMQVHTRVHKEKFSEKGKRREQFTVYENLRVGTKILKGYISRAGTVAGGLKRYVGAANHANDGGYGRRVMGEYRRLCYAARGKVTYAVRLLWKKLEPPTSPSLLTDNHGTYQPYRPYTRSGAPAAPGKLLVSAAN